MESGTKSRYLELIRNVHMLKYLSEEELTTLLGQSEIIHLKKGERIIVQDDKSEYLYAILEGSVDVTVNSGSEEVFIKEIGAYEVFGEAAIFSTERRTANVSSSGNTVVIRIHQADILSFFKSHPSGGIKILMFIIRGLLKKLNQTNMEIIQDRGTDVQLDDVDGFLQGIIDDGE